MATTILAGSTASKRSRAFRRQYSENVPNRQRTTGVILGRQWRLKHQSKTQVGASRPAWRTPPIPRIASSKFYLLSVHHFLALVDFRLYVAALAWPEAIIIKCSAQEHYKWNRLKASSPLSGTKPGEGERALARTLALIMHRIALTRVGWLEGGQFTKRDHARQS